MRRNRLRRWLRRHGHSGRVSHVHYFSERHDLPDLPKANEVAVAGTPDFPKWLLMDCPCGHGHTILLPLSRSVKPHWTLTVNKRGEPSLAPSVDRNRDQGARCHFWLREGSIHWA